MIFTQSLRGRLALVSFLLFLLLVSQVPQVRLQEEPAEADRNPSPLQPGNLVVSRYWGDKSVKTQSNLNRRQN